MFPLQIVFPPSLAMVVASVSALIMIGILGVLEITGVNLKYSKFSNANSGKESGRKIPSKVGMFLLYAPAAFIGFASFWVFPDGDLRFFFLKSAVTIHFLKRVLEVLFVHKYSREMGLDSTIIITSSYSFLSLSLIYAQLQMQGIPDPPIDLMYPGIVVFLIGISGNFYHHYLLSKLRAGGDKSYKIPKGGLFGWVICPHYLFEITAFMGISFISQSLYSYCATLGVAIYLMGRSYVSRKWYVSKFEDFPKEIMALIPYVF